MASSDACIAQLLHAEGIQVLEERLYDEIPPKYAQIPSGLHPAVLVNLQSRFPSGLYSHQTLAIARGIAGDSIGVCTKTASGKTAIFSSITAHKLLTDAGATALALYPAKALIHDQLSKWEQALQGTGISAEFIHGGIPVQKRAGLLGQGRVVLMTPDVLHAWLMANLGQPEVKKFVGALEIVILDEAHIYDGVFGTNMCYLLRRLQAISGAQQFLSSTATIGEPERFLTNLTGISPVVIGGENDGARTPEKKIMLARIAKREARSIVRKVAVGLADAGCGRFIIFADSRKGVEELAATVVRNVENVTIQADGEDQAGNDSETIAEATISDLAGSMKVLPYRAGYEEDDRSMIQEALTSGRLSGVVSTSALELGLDIGEIETVVTIGAPPTVKSFWQRAGRAGRAGRGVVLMLDIDGRVQNIGLNTYLDRSPEPAWVYLENEYLQFANALCAAEEYSQCTKELYSDTPLRTLPTAFLQFLDNEISPKSGIPNELYSLKQQAIGGAHRAFPLRSGIEKTYSVKCNDTRIGSLSYSQVLQEGYPGAIYRYLSRPYRIVQINHYEGEIRAVAWKGWASTRPETLTKVFPQFGGGYFDLLYDDGAFVCESRLQVSIRVTGFEEAIGKSSKNVKYEPGCSYSQKPLNRFFETTGVSFYFPDAELQKENIAKYLTLALCMVCAVHERDVGFGTFYSSCKPMQAGECRGFTIFDASYGSLRLTSLLLQRLKDVFNEAIRLASEEGAQKVVKRLQTIRATIGDMRRGDSSLESQPWSTNKEDDWITVISPGELAVLHDGASHVNEDVKVLLYVYTPQGLKYQLHTSKQGVTWTVNANMVRPIHGETRLLKYNLMTGETKEIL